MEHSGKLKEKEDSSEKIFLNNLFSNFIAASEPEPEPSEEKEEEKEEEPSEVPAEGSEAEHEYEDDLETDRKEVAAQIMARDVTIQNATFEAAGAIEDDQLAQQGRDDVAAAADNAPPLADADQVLPPADPQAQVVIDIRDELGDVRDLLQQMLDQNRPAEPTLAGRVRQYIGAFFGPTARTITAALATYKLVQIFGGGSGNFAFITSSLEKTDNFAANNDPSQISKDALRKIVRAWQNLPEDTWWNYYADYIDKRPRLTLYDQILFLHFTMDCSPPIPTLWDSDADRLAIINQLYDNYTQEGNYISDFYRHMATIKYKGTFLPRASAASELMYGLGKILQHPELFPLKRKPLPTTKIQQASSKIKLAPPPLHAAQPMAEKPKRQWLEEVSSSSDLHEHHEVTHSNSSSSKHTASEIEKDPAKQDKAEKPSHHASETSQASFWKPKSLPAEEATSSSSTHEHQKSDHSSTEEHNASLDKAHKR